MIKNMENASKQKKILIIDDSAIARLGVKKMLLESNYIIEEGVNGIEAINKMESFKPDLMIIDYLMPEMNGMIALKIIRSKGDNTPVIIISANQQDATKIKFKELNIIGMIKKHPDKRELTSLIELVFGNEIGDNI